MASLHLTMTEHQYYEDIFSYCCENADSDSVPVIKVAELLRSANLPGVVTMKVNYIYSLHIVCQLLVFCHMYNYNIKIIESF